MSRRPVAFRLDEELWGRVVARADELGQTRTLFVVRALEQALGRGASRSQLAVSQRESAASAGPAPARASEPSPAVREAREALDAPSPFFAEAEKLRQAGVRPAREFVKPFRPLPKKS